MEVNLNIWAGVYSWGILSAIACFSMTAEVNRKAAQMLPEKDNISYKWNRWTVSVCFVIIILSAVVGYVAALRAISVEGWIQLSISYAAVLSAAIIDCKLHIIPNSLVLFLVFSRLLVLVYEFIFGSFTMLNLISSILGCGLCFVVLLGMDKVFQGGIGKGDVKFLSALGFANGVYAVFSVLLLALICCILVSAVLLVLKKVTMKDHLPFGPYIWMGYLCMIFLTY